MTAEPLDELYFKWLYRQVAALSLRNPSRTYFNLLRQLHSKEFTWFVPNDDNRVADGIELRYEFLDEIQGDADEAWLTLGCSMLEMLIALARRLSFASEGASAEWFWHMMANVDLRKYNDRYYDLKSAQLIHDQIDLTLERIIKRDYDYNGHGGLFPLRHAITDQREVELWYQMNAYIIERG